MNWKQGLAQGPFAPGAEASDEFWQDDRRPEPSTRVTSSKGQGSLADRLAAMRNRVQAKAHARELDEILDLQAELDAAMKRTDRALAESAARRARRG